MINHPNRSKRRPCPRCANYPALLARLVDLEASIAAILISDPVRGPRALAPMWLKEIRSTLAIGKPADCPRCSNPISQEEWDKCICWTCNPPKEGK